MVEVDTKESIVNSSETIICFSFSGDCFDTDCPKAKKLKDKLPKEIIDIIKIYMPGFNLSN